MESLFRLLLATAGPGNVPDVSAALAALEAESDESGDGKVDDNQQLEDTALAIAEEAASRTEAAAAARVGFIPLATTAAAAAQLAALHFSPASSPSGGAHGGSRAPEHLQLGLDFAVARAERWLGAALPRVADWVLFALADDVPGAIARCRG